MPIYEYVCESCGKESEIIQKFSDPAPAACDTCGKGPVTKKVSLSSFALKGNGWYVTDFKGGSAPKPTSDEAPKAEETPKKAEPAAPKAETPSKEI